MNTVTDIYNAYIEAEAYCRRLAEKICDKENSISRFEKQISRLEKKKYGVNWIDNIVRPLAELLTPLLECEDYRILGPFGLRAETSIFFRKADSPEKSCDYSLSLTVRTEYNNDSTYKGRYCEASVKNVCLYYNTGISRNIYPQGSIGELNGMNFIEEPLPEDTDTIIQIIKEKAKR